MIEKVSSMGVVGQCILIAIITVVAICVVLVVDRYKREKEQERQAELAMKRRRAEIERQKADEKRKKEERKIREAKEKERIVRNSSTKLKRHAEIVNEFNKKVHNIKEEYYFYLRAKSMQQFRQIVDEGKDALKRVCSEQDIKELKKIIDELEENQMVMRSVEIEKGRVPETDEEIISATGLSVHDFRTIENTIIAWDYTVTAVQDTKWVIKVIYDSPTGKNHRSYDIAVWQYGMRTFLRNEAKKNYQADTKKAERSKMNSSLRYDVLRRDGFKCQLCGRSAGDGIQLEVDHIKPISKGGKTERSNLRTLCRDCNRGKSDKLE